MLRTQLRSGLAHVGLALREPEEFARRFHAAKSLIPGGSSRHWPSRRSSARRLMV